MSGSRARGKRVWIILSYVLVLAGIVIGSWHGTSYLYAEYSQRQLRRDMERLQDPVMVMPVSRSDIGRVEQVQEQEHYADTGPFLLEIPVIDVEAVVVNGVDELSLAQGPGFYDGSPMPGQEGNVCVAGHRTTYGAWFRRVDELQPGDIISFTSATEVYEYEVQRVFVVASDAWEVVAWTEIPSLTLTTCHPRASARQRLVVRARLKDNG